MEHREPWAPGGGKERQEGNARVLGEWMLMALSVRKVVWIMSMIYSCSHMLDLFLCHLVGNFC
jgi:hypothetical protein